MSEQPERHRSDELFDGLPEVDPDALAQAGTALDVAGVVYRARVLRGLTQAEVARQSGLKQQAVSRIEGGTLNITVGTLERVLRRLGYALEFRLIDERSGDIVENVILNDSRQRMTSRGGVGSMPATPPRWSNDARSSLPEDVAEGLPGS